MPAIPPTRNHRQLAQWINRTRLTDEQGRTVAARVERWRASTDRKVSGTRLRIAGKGRNGLRLTLYLIHKPLEPIYQHTSSETYRRHEEARAWIAKHLRIQP